jgi:methionine-rich copper-binding protein CopC
MFMGSKRVRSAIFSAAAFAIAGAAITACGELTGPESPSTPTNVVVTLVSATSATVTWTPSPLNDGVISYSIYRNGNKVGESETTSFTDTGLAQQTTYVYSVAANCKGGVISDRSAETAQSTVTTVDITPPRVLSTIPVDGATGVSRAGTSTVTFSEPMDPSTINTSTFNIRITSSGQILPGTVTYNATTRVAEFIPTTPLPNAVNLTVTVTTGVKDLAGNAMSAPFSVKWTTRDEDGPTVVSSSPTNGATGVSATAAITVTFSEAVAASSINATNIFLRLASGGANVPGSIVFNGTNFATFTPSSPLSQGVSYSFNVSGVLDLAGNPMPAPFVITFTVGDNTAPTVVSTVPADLASGVPANSTISATFSEAMDPLTLNTATFIVRPTAGGPNVGGTVTYTAGTNTATFTPSSPLAGGTAYTATITTGAKDVAGNGLAANKTWTFGTLDATPPTVTSVVPANGATNVAPNATVQVTFSEPMDASTITTTNIVLRNTGTSAVVPATVTYNAATNVATLTPNGPLSNSTGYTLTVTTGVKDAAGNALATQFTSQFNTAGIADTTAPTITARNPAPNATNVATNTTVTVTFSEPMDSTTINSTNFKLAPTPTPGAPVAATVTYNAATNTATLTPTSPLGSSVNYTATVTTGVKDVAGNALASQSTWTFTTIADTTAPTVLTTNPVNGATNVAVNSTITVTFSEDMDPTTLNGTLTNFTVKTTVGSVPVPGTVSYNNATRTATFTPTASLAANTNYTVTVTSGAKDTAGNGLAGNFTFTFQTAP